MPRRTVTDVGDSVAPVDCSSYRSRLWRTKRAAGTVAIIAGRECPHVSADSAAAESIIVKGNRLRCAVWWALCAIVDVFRYGAGC